MARSTKRWRKIAIISDLHSVYLDERAFKVFLSVYTENDFDELVINGDLVDFPQLHDKTKRVRDKVDLGEEINFTIQHILKPLHKAKKGKVPILYKPGNHELRVRNALASNANGLAEMVGLAYQRGTLDLDDLLELDSFNATLSLGEDGEHVDFFRRRGGRCAVLHGTKTAKTRTQQYLRHFLCHGTSGHTHKLTRETVPYYGGSFVWVESGCLRTIRKVQYLPEGHNPGWDHGFVTLWIDQDTGQMFLKGHHIDNYQLEFHGQVFKA